MLHLVWALFTRACARLHKTTTTATKLVKTLNNTVDNSDESKTYEERELKKIQELWAQWEGWDHARNLASFTSSLRLRRRCSKYLPSAAGVAIPVLDIMIVSVVRGLVKYSLKS